MKTPWRWLPIILYGIALLLTALILTGTLDRLLSPDRVYPSGWKEIGGHGGPSATWVWICRVDGTSGARPCATVTPEP